MQSATKPLIFISYRRIDSAYAARYVYKVLQDTFGEDRVFMDTENIRVGDKWRERIDAALDAANTLIVVIGKEWLRADDEYGRRRLDNANDWVRNEISTAVTRHYNILPLLIGAAARPPKQGLPANLRALNDSQAFSLRDETCSHDLDHVVRALTELGFRRRDNVDIQYPKPRRFDLRELSDQEIDAAIRTKLPKWRLVHVHLPDRPGDRSELLRTYDFRSFKRAIDFMYAASIKTH